MPDDPLVGQLAEVVARALHPEMDRDEIVVMPDEYAGCYAVANAVLSWLAEQGLVPLAEVLDALGDEAAVAAHAEQHGTSAAHPVQSALMRQYLAERFPTAPQRADERTGTDER